MGYRILILLTGLLWFFTQTMAQTPIRRPSEATSIIPPSPTAAALGKYGEIPVSLYTGIPNISIPLFTISEGGLQLPVSLNYHAGGIKVEDEASWTGLGWSLFSGGTITRSIRGLDDLRLDGEAYFQGYPDYIFPSISLDYDGDISGLGNNQKAYLGDVYNKIKDSEPDIFYFNFGGAFWEILYQSENWHRRSLYFPYRIKGKDFDTAIQEAGLQYGMAVGVYDG